MQLWCFKMLARLEMVATSLLIPICAFACKFLDDLGGICAIGLKIRGSLGLHRNQLPLQPATSTPKKIWEPSKEV